MDLRSSLGSSSSASTLNESEVIEQEIPSIKKQEIIITGDMIKEKETLQREAIWYIEKEIPFVCQEIRRLLEVFFFKKKKL